MKKLIAFLVTVTGTCLVAQAHGTDSCSVCGCRENIRRVCKAVPETKKVKEVKWECKCEDICIPGRTQTHDCEPRCGRARTITKLVKKEVTKEVCGYKWEITNVCDNCCGNLPEGSITAPSHAGQPAPAPIPIK
jgi:hypothetical protein